MGQCETDSLRDILRKDFYSSMNAILSKLSTLADDPDNATQITELFILMVNEQAEALFAYNVLTNEEYDAVQNKVTAVENWAHEMQTKPRSRR